MTFSTEKINKHNGIYLNTFLPFYLFTIFYMIITQKLLQNIVDGKVAKDKIDVPFIVIRDVIRIPCIESVAYNYAVVYDNVMKREGKDEVIANEVEIERALAMKLIKKYNMGIALEKRGTRFYEAPDRPYQNKYKGKGVRYI